MSNNSGNTNNPSLPFTADGRPSGDNADTTGPAINPSIPQTPGDARKRVNPESIPGSNGGISAPTPRPTDATGNGTGSVGNARRPFRVK